MLKIGDKIIVSNEAVRITRSLGSSKFVARYDTEDCDEYEAVFLGWVTVYAGTVQLGDDFKRGRRTDENGRMLTRHPVRLAVVQPVRKQQWRKPRRTLLSGQTHSCPCGAAADSPRSGYCVDCAYDIYYNSMFDAACN